MPANVAWKVGSVKEMKSVLTELSFKIVKAPRLWAFLPTSSMLIFTPFEPTSIPAYTDELLYFNLKLLCARIEKTVSNRTNARASLDIFCMEEMFCLIRKINE